MAIPHDDTLQREILELLAPAPDGRMHVHNVYRTLADSHPEVTYQERTLKYRNSKSKWANRVQFARLHLEKRGFVFRAGAGPSPARGVWIITPSGRQAIAAPVGETPPVDEVPNGTAESLFGGAEANAEVEQAAVKLVRRRLESDGWKVRSVERERCAYDLDCHRGKRNLHVEVKGTRNEPTQFVITAGELRRAREDSEFVLVVVGHALSAKPTVEQWPGGSFEDVFQVTPLDYVARRGGA